MRNIKREIKWAWQRVFRGYDDRIFWEFDSYFHQFIPAIEKFCVDTLLDKNFVKFNPEKIEIFTEVLSKINDYRAMDTTDEYKHPNQTSKLWSYFGEHISYFWD